MNENTLSPILILRLGEHPILDFCNTLLVHEDSVEDRLETNHGIVAVMNQLFNTEIQDPPVREILVAREVIRDYFHAIVRDEDVAPALKNLNKLLSSKHISFQFDENRKIFTKGEPSALNPILTSLIDLLSFLKAERLKKCSNPNCSHLFYDFSKNNSRQWCSMKSCGNIMKARAFRSRHKVK